MSYSTEEFLVAIEESNMPVSAKLIRDSLLNKTYTRVRAISEAPVSIKKMELKKEKQGLGISVILGDDHEYRYAASDTHPKYNTPESLFAAANKLLKFRPAGAVLGWLDRNGILYYGSKRGQNADFPKESVDFSKVALVEEVSSQVRMELEDLISSLHPDFSKEDIKDAAFSFLEDFNITNDTEYYRLGPGRLRKALL